MSFHDYQTERRRLAILRLLSRFPAYTTDEITLAAALDEQGHAVSRDRLRTDLAWLSEQYLLIVKHADTVHIATLSSTGYDAGKGLASVPGVAKPRPGE